MVEVDFPTYAGVYMVFVNFIYYVQTFLATGLKNAFWV